MSNQNSKEERNSMEPHLERQSQIQAYRAVPDTILLNVQSRLGYLTPEWAARQYQLGKASREACVERNQLAMELAEAHFRNALHVYTAEDYPRKRMMVLYELGSLYETCSKRERMKALEMALGFYQEGLELALRFSYEWIDPFTQALSQIDQEQQEHKSAFSMIRVQQPELMKRALPWFIPKRPHRAIIYLATFLLIVLSFASLMLWNNSHVLAVTLSLQKQWNQPRPGTTWVHNVAWSPNGRYIAVLWDDSTIQVLDVKTNKVICTQQVGWGIGLAWSPDGQILASVGRVDNTVQLWSISNTQCKMGMSYLQHMAPVESIAWAPDGHFIASASDDQTVQVWDTSTLKPLYVYHDDATVNAIDWSPDGSRIVSGDSNNHLRAWDAFTGKNLVSYQGHTGAVTSVSWMNNTILSSSYDGTARIWDASSGKNELTLKIDLPILVAAWSPKDSSYLALGCYDGSVQLWSISETQGVMHGDKLDVYPKGDSKTDNRPRSGIFTVSWSPDGWHLAAGGQGTTLMLTFGN